MLASLLVELVWLNNASIPNFSFQGVVGGVGLTVIIMQVSVPIGLNLTGLELNLAILMYVPYIEFYLTFCMYALFSNKNVLN